MSQTIPSNVRFVMRMERAFRNWIPILLSLFVLFNALPIIAPIAMKTGLTPVGNVIYSVYGGLLSHQYANRSFFLFGEKLMYTPDDLPFDLQDEFLPDTDALEAFRGSTEFGWKLAWSDRLVAMYGSMLLTFIAFAKFRWKHFPLWLGVLLALPLIIDGATHMHSDSASVISGYRYDNAWLASLTGDAFSPSFYIGDALGSFNSTMRLISGILLGIGFFGWAMPITDRYFHRNADTLAQKLDNWRNRQEK
ncbi:MAG: DUF2085 domain-containing protein [Anaerolineae bacterium]|nr:DUF2085 domain-containing protein [Anaerolineae bacterium]